MPISLTNEQSQSLQTELLIETATRLLLETDYSTAQVDILLTDDRTIQDLNSTYRGFDKPTDVLSFAQLDQDADSPELPPAPDRPMVLGDVVISVDTALRQAEAHGVTLEQELALLTAHGILHLIGYEDETEAGAVLMHSKERELLGFTYPSAALPG
jgi:probable rRNA maturation factor